MINFDHSLGFSGLLHLIASEIKGNPFRNCLTNGLYSKLSLQHDFCSQLLDDQNKVPFNVLRKPYRPLQQFQSNGPKEYEERIPIHDQQCHESNHCVSKGDSVIL